MKASLVGVNLLSAYPSARAKVALITGAASGIGAAAAGHLLGRGWRVSGWDLVPGTDSRIDWRTVDITDPGQARAAAEGLDAVNLLVNAAGAGGGGPAETLRPAEWDRVIRTNLSGCFYVSQAVHGALARGRGLIVNLASVTAHRAGEGRAAYCTSKAGVVMLTEVLGLEWARHGIRVVALSPSYVRTPMVERALAGGTLDEQRIVHRTPQRRLLDPDEVAGVIHALTTETFAAVTGSTIRVDGGWTANGDY